MISKQNYFNRNFLLKSFDTVLFQLILVATICLKSTTLNAQVFECGVEGIDPGESSFFEPREVSSCNLANESTLCVRIKFHFLNNTADPIDAPSDAFYYDLLKKINEVYAPGKIKFTFDDNCIHRETLSQGLRNIINAPSLAPNNHHKVITLAGQSISSTYNYAYQEEFEEDPNSINIYSLQEQIPNAQGSTTYRFFAHYYKRAIVPLTQDNIAVLIHEVGHTLGLIHTFGKEGGFDPEDTSDNTIDYRLCKNPAAVFQSTNKLKCLAAQDLICDTGLDPWLLDLGPGADGKVDHHKWVDPLTCTQKTELLNTYEDECDDMVTNWDVPAKNYMSYYRTCRSEFTTGQFCYIHESFNQPSSGGAKVVACNNDLYAGLIPCSAPDITVNTTQTWTNETITLCPNQKIIIGPGGALTLNHCVLTKVNQISPNSGCPDLVYDQLWDGIYSNGGTLIINDSQIKYSKKGIQSTVPNNTAITNSLFENNLAQINVTSSYGSTVGAVRIRNSAFFIAPPSLSVTPLAKAQISVVGRQLWMTQSKVINPTSSFESELTGVRSAFGFLRIENASYFENFHLAIDKAGDFGSPGSRGCFIYGSEIRNCENSILNTCKFFNAYGNILEGNITSEGMGYSQWYRNNITADKAILQSPKLSCRLENNLFNRLNLEFYGTNKLSYSTCNTWMDASENIAFSGLEGVTLPNSWGGGEYVVSSGNRNFDQVDPSMIAEDYLKNYYFPSYANEIFTYDPIAPLLTGASALSSRSCGYDYPIFPPVPVNDPQLPQINYTTENTLWNSLNTAKSGKESALVNASGSQAIKLSEDINYIKFQMADIVGRVLLSLDSSHASIASTWNPRADQDVWLFSDLAELLLKEEFTQVEDEIGSTSDEDAETLLLAIDYLKRICSTTKHINQLNSVELDSLTFFASLTFGDYSNLIRDLLRVYYNVDIPWPTEQGIVPRSANSATMREDRSKEPRMKLSPNPTKECFEILRGNNNVGTENFDVYIYNLQGKLLRTILLTNSNQICLNEFDKGMYILTILHPDSGGPESFRLVLN